MIWYPFLVQISSKNSCTLIFAEVTSCRVVGAVITVSEAHNLILSQTPYEFPFCRLRPRDVCGRWGETTAS